MHEWEKHALLQRAGASNVGINTVEAAYRQGLILSGNAKFGDRVATSPLEELRRARSRYAAHVLLQLREDAARNPDTYAGVLIADSFRAISLPPDTAWRHTVHAGLDVSVEHDPVTHMDTYKVVAKHVARILLATQDLDDDLVPRVRKIAVLHGAWFPKGGQVHG